MKKSADFMMSPMSSEARKLFFSSRKSNPALLTTGLFSGGSKSRKADYSFYITS